MIDGIEVRPDMIRSSASGIRQTAQSLESHTADFQARVNGLVEQPGNDMVSPLIWTAHGLVFQVAMKCMSSNINGLGAHAEHLETTAKAHDLTEEANAAGINRVREILG